MSVNQKLLAGVDIGGTKTRILARLGSLTVADETIVTDGWRIRQMEPDAAKLASIVIDLCSGSAPAAMAVGAHGCDTDEQCRRFQALLSAKTGGQVKVVNDAELMVPAAGYVDGVGVVAGTGSIAVARTAKARCWPRGAGAGSSATRAVQQHWCARQPRRLGVRSTAARMAIR
jgi:N-acetylglucosamine kinase-like BadF-type ATPase